MPSHARAPLHPKSESAPNLDFYRMRDEFVRAYNPASAEEQLLVVQITRAWMHLQDVYELRSRVTAEKGLVHLFNEDFEKYKFLMRNLAETERMWRHAVQEFSRARRRNGAPVSIAKVNIIPIRQSESHQTASPPPACDLKTAPLYNDKPRL